MNRRLFPKEEMRKLRKKQMEEKRKIREKKRIEASKKRRLKLKLVKPKSIKKPKKTKKLVNELFLGSTKRTRTKKKNSSYDIL